METPRLCSRPPARLLRAKARCWIHPRRPKGRPEFEAHAGPHLPHETAPISRRTELDSSPRASWDSAIGPSAFRVLSPPRLSGPCAIGLVDKTSPTSTIPARCVRISCLRRTRGSEFFLTEGSATESVTFGPIGGDSLDFAGRGLLGRKSVVNRSTLRPLNERDWLDITIFCWRTRCG